MIHEAMTYLDDIGNLKPVDTARARAEAGASSRR